VTKPLKPPQAEVLPKIGAGCLILLGLFIGLSAVFAVLAGGEEVAGLVVMTMLGFIFIASGVFWWRFVTGSEVRRRAEFQDKTVLAVAARHGGCTTVAQIALESDMSTEDARIAVERLCIRGIAQPDVRDDGNIEYRFGGLVER
jgi:hypothetical protein